MPTKKSSSSTLDQTNIEFLLQEKASLLQEKSSLSTQLENQRQISTYLGTLLIQLLNAYEASPFASRPLKSITLLWAIKNWKSILTFVLTLIEIISHFKANVKLDKKQDEDSSSPSVS